MKIRQINKSAVWKSFKWVDCLAHLLALLGGIIFVIGVVYFAHHQYSVFDEGFYAYEGSLYVLGEYEPYQDYGFPANQMPLAYLIPGAIQVIFGPDFMAGRYGAIAIASLMMIGLWLGTNRLGGKWISCFVVWAVALNPAMMRMYSQLTTQVITVSLLVWMMALILGENRRTWQIIIGSIFAGILVSTRINMLPVVPLLVWYVFWQHGRKAGFLALFTSVFPLALLHVIYWPNILRLWAYWSPAQLSALLGDWRLPAGLVSIWRPPFDTADRLTSLYFTLQAHFLAFMSVLVSWLLWPGRKKWKSSADFKASVFLSILFVVLFVVHIWASLGMYHCVYCLQSYLGFFSVLAFLLISVSAKSLDMRSSRLRQVMFLCVGIIILLGITLSADRATIILDEDGYWHPFWGRLGENLIKPILWMSVPRVKDLHILPGVTNLWVLFENKFGWTLFEQFEIAYRLVAFSIALATVLGLSRLIIFLGRRTRAYSINYGSAILVAIILLGMAFSPSDVLGDAYDTYDCDPAVTSSYREIARDLDQLIPAGADVYWEVYSPMILLYLPDIQIHPPQIYLTSFKTTDGDPDTVLRFGWWNEALEQQWIQEADFILIEHVYLLADESLASQISESGFDESMQTTLSVPCLENSLIHVYQKTTP
ncbi:MAG: glycosyltransferase family 39 protein [Chloroflexi bacterium]|nr:glycosyltransferase family 39 protein [Chloroflexota bacterium]